jgi:hypothetical protein
VDLLKSSIDAANIEDCSALRPNHTMIHTTISAPTSEEPLTTPYNPCASNPCIHGHCQSSNTYDYSCTCEYGYVGRNCENVLKQCELLSPCRNGGSCTDLHGSYKCDCRLGYNGQDCEKCRCANHCADHLLYHISRDLLIVTKRCGSCKH